MLLTCPACDTQYKVDDAAISPGGSRVRCFRCSYTWSAKPDGARGESAQTGAAQTGAAQSEPALTPKPQEKPENAEVTEPEAQAGEATRPESQSPKPAAVPEKPKETAPKSLGEDALRAKHRERAEEEAERPLWPYYLLVLVLSLTLMVLLWSYRETLARAHPLATQAYGFFGYEAVLAGDGLTLESIRSVRREVSGARELRIEGEVVNVSGEVRPMPALRIRLLDESGAELASWTETLREESLEPQERALFSFSRADPPPAAADIAIEFVPLPRE